ncbi:MAG TPA: hypothetical protein VLA99_05960 [Nitrospiraceae bacterium]|nr:hypothetical protein [Nitrospiraceae bacterium]
MPTSISRDVSSVSFTRPADTTAYASGDQVANSTTAGSVVPLNFPGCSNGVGRSLQIRRVRIGKSGTSVTNAAFRLHLFNVLPTVGAGDNAAISFTTGMAKYLGQVDVTVGQAFGDGAAGQATTDISCYPVAGASNLYGLLEARGAYTPASAEVFTIALEVAQD